MFNDKHYLLIGVLTRMAMQYSNKYLHKENRLVSQAVSLIGLPEQAESTGSGNLSVVQRCGKENEALATISL
jgi:hypothetical protein